MAEALLEEIGGNTFIVESAGLEPGTLNPFAVRAMAEIGIDISGNITKSVFDFFKQGRLYSHVVSVCDESDADQCPLFPGVGKILHWSFPDPSKFIGSDDEILKKTVEIRDAIRKRIETWLNELSCN
jgi:arsenate reductase (thioredoxin)